MKARVSLEGWITSVVIALFLALGILYVFWKPIQHAPDENDHFIYVFCIYQYHELPRMWRPEVGGIGQGHQPPLYYLVLAGVYGLFGPSLDSPNVVETAYRLLRLATLCLLGLPLVWLSGRLCAHLAPRDAPVLLLTLAATAFLPMFLHLASSLGAVEIDTVAVACLTHGDMVPVRVIQRMVRALGKNDARAAADDLEAEPAVGILVEVPSVVPPAVSLSNISLCPGGRGMLYPEVNGIIIRPDDVPVGAVRDGDIIAVAVEEKR